jgi:GNAT superfamily N-acetyltransferase
VGVTLEADRTVGALRFVAVHQSDPLAQPLLDELAVEYSSRYGGDPAVRSADLKGYPAEEFSPPSGALIVGLIANVPVAGGAFRRYDSTTAELKRIWTSSGYRRRGLGMLVVAELERIAADAGYTRIYLTTGWSQPEAVALYLSAGYTALYDPALPAREVGPHPFEKYLVR